MTSHNRLLLTSAATIIGGFSLFIFTTITKDILFKGSSICSSTIMEHLLLTLTLFTSALVAGFMASIIVLRRHHMPHLILSIFVLGKISFVMTCGYGYQEMVMDSAMNAALILGLWAGNYTASKFPLAPF